MSATDTTPVSGFSHMQLHVSDLDASVDWYTKALGLVELRRFDSGTVTMHAPGARFRLVLSTGGQPDNRGALNHFALSVADSDSLRTWVARLDEIGIAHEGIHAGPVGESVDLFDPDGNNVELINEA